MKGEGARSEHPGRGSQAPRGVARQDRGRQPGGRGQQARPLHRLHPRGGRALPEIHKDPSLVDVYTRRWNLVAVVSDGSAVLGLGNLGARAAMPVMEGKSVLFKAFAGVDAFPICLDTQDPDEIVRTVQLLTPTFGGVNLEDISAPRCFDVERRLKETTDIPIFHDDQHGTAVVVMSGIINACRLTDRGLGDLHVVINGAGAAGIACAKLLLDVGVKDILLCDSKGIVCSERQDLNPVKREMLGGPTSGICVAAWPTRWRGPTASSACRSRTRSPRRWCVPWTATPSSSPWPTRIRRSSRTDAKKAGAAVVATGRSDFPNQVNNVLGFPGIFRGALDVRASDVNEAMKIAAAHALADLVGDELSFDLVIPEPFDLHIAPAVAEAVARAAMESGVARLPRDPGWVRRHTEELLGVVGS